MYSYSKEIDRLIEGWRDEIIQALRRWISVNSVAGAAEGEGQPYGAEVRAMLDIAIADARAMGFEANDVDGRVGEVHLGRGEATMGILAHLDVVPAGDGWVHPPFGGAIEDGKLYGRGTSDDKGPAVAALFAMRAVRDAGIALRDGVRLILGCDEEVGMTDMRHYVKVRRMPDYGFSPDAGYPLINLEKGGLGLQLSAAGGDEDGANIPVYSLWAGERVNVVPALAIAELGVANISLAQLRAALGEGFTVEGICNGRARVEAHGKSSHGAAPEGGVNAAGKLLIALSKLNAGGGSAGPIAALAEKLGMQYDGAGLGIAQREEKSGPLTCNLGLLRYDGAHLTAQLDIRYPIGADEADMCGKAVMALSPGGLSVRRLSGRPVYHVPEDHRVVKNLLEVYRDITGLPAYTIAIGGGTYSRMMPDTVAFGASFPGDDERAHQPDEYIEIDKLLLSARIMAHAIERLAGAKG
ncbi:MAG: M20 family metallopeptidase [Clostridiales bacterium]|nr:M20 family metallopeptidase [Clostridiales bacterium]